MTFAPVLPARGIAGLAFLDRTMPRQRAAHDNQAALLRDEAYFRDSIGKIRTAEALVSDRRLLRVALTAFGLEADVDSRFFIRKVLEEGTLTPGALANRLADKRYRALAAAFGFGDFPIPSTQISDFADRILGPWKTRRFEAAVGAQDEPLRLALNARRELPELAARDMGGDARWFTLMGNPPLRRVVETAFGLPKAFGALDIDRQLAVFKDRARRTLGTDDVAGLADPARLDQLIRRFLLRAEATGGSPAGGAGSPALVLLQAAQRR
ncbi:MAG: DUF1217 domain-containing protein [Gemmobacter sp.]